MSDTMKPTNAEGMSEEPFSEAKLNETLRFVDLVARGATGAFAASLGTIYEMVDEIRRLKSERDRYIAERDDLRTSVNRLAVRAAEAEAIVSKLPKTADGVAIVPGMRVWTNDAIDPDPITDGVYANGEIVVIGAQGIDLIDAIKLHSTREAALAAQPKADAPAGGGRGNE